MGDVFSAEKRSDVMSRIRSTNTKSELIVFRYLRKNGVYFQKYYTRIPGKPDIALPRKKKAVFIDGDFWHGRNYSQLVARPAPEYWLKKIARNMDRDIELRAGLEERGWQVLQIWDSDIKRKRTREQALEQIRQFLKS